ncbi:MAG: hypothetical protein JXR46_11050 [Calditrichaceae bacterium]|nr:hypothetical protein [Calditrichaceae bacterium]MBN2709570.1 hypothetical protein [Calditrichaceae bacterium]
MIQIEEKNDVNPVCPHCKNELTSIWFREVPAFLGKRYIYFCVHCKSVLGISHRKGFWMG